MTKMANIDDKLIKKILNSGDKTAYDVLVLKYQNRIASLVNLFVKDSHEAEDLTQEVFLKAYLHLKSFKGKSSFYTWLHRIAINTAKNHLLVKKKVNLIDIDDEEEISTNALKTYKDSPLEFLSANKMGSIIYSAINNMPKKLKVSLIFREFYGMSYNDISKILNCPLGTIRSRLFRAREILDKQIDKYLNAE